MTKETNPVDPSGTLRETPVVVHSTVTDPASGARWVHKDLVQVRGAYEDEAHIKPMGATEKFGDVESWVGYVRRYANGDRALLTWNGKGLFATIDYAHIDGEPGRCQWKAEHPFVTSIQWRSWRDFACGTAMGQKQAVEKLEDLSEDIQHPALTDLMAILRGLRASVNAKAETEIRADGTTAVAFAQDTSVRSKAGEVTLPSHIAIAIPVLKGHLGADGKPVVYRLDVRVRVSVDDNAHLAFRFSIPNAERVLEAVWEDRVRLAIDMLGDEFELLRAAD